MQIREILFRVFVDENEIDNTIHFYENLYQDKCKLRFSYPKVGLTLAQVKDCLIIAGSPQARSAYESTKITMIVDSICVAERVVEALGGNVLEVPKEVPTGWNMRVKHPDGLVVEYVEYRVE